MIDTHTHLNFSRFKKNADEVIQRAKEAGIEKFIVPGTDIKTSQKAIEIAQRHEGIYAAVGIHPHHVFSITNYELKVTSIVYELEQLLMHPKAVAVGEIGLDKHIYKETKYEAYNISEEFSETQKMLLIQQLNLALRHNKSIILHNREASEDLLKILSKHWAKEFEGRTVFHCCEPDNRLLEFAKEHRIYIGVDGDVTYDKKKQEFIKQVPLDLLVLETDSPFLLPEPIRTRKEYPNEPKNIPVIAACVARLLGVSEREIEKATDRNAKRLFNL